MIEKLAVELVVYKPDVNWSFHLMISILDGATVGLGDTFVAVSLSDVFMHGCLEMFSGQWQ